MKRRQKRKGQKNRIFVPVSLYHFFIITCSKNDAKEKGRRNQIPFSGIGVPFPRKRFRLVSIIDLLFSV